MRMVLHRAKRYRIYVTKHNSCSRKIDMKVIFASMHDPDPDTWILPLQRELPDVEIINWQDEAAAVNAQLAVVWNPPESLFTRETQLQGVLNLGAGVDALLRLPDLPDDLPIVRLED